MKYSTIQLTPRMRRRLARYKLPGMSYEDVIAILTKAIPPDEFRARHQRALAAAANDIGAAVDRAPTAAAEEGRRIEAERLQRLSPAERMEEAFRLFALVRGVG